MSSSPNPRLALIRLANGLPQATFEELVFALDAPRSVIPSNMSEPGTRSSALLKWVEGSTGCGMDEFLKVLNEIAPVPSELRTALHWQGNEQRFHVPYPRNAFFTGRDAVLERLHERLQGGRAAINQAQGISGLGGIGKTQTVVEYAYRSFYKDEPDYDWVFWIRADTRLNVRTDVATIAQQVGMVADLAMEPDLQLEAALQWLKRHGKWLLIVDNADGADGDEGDGERPDIRLPLEELPQYLPMNPEGRILVTSRIARLDVLNIAWPLSLQTWSREESVAFLLKRTSCTDTKAHRRGADAVAVALGNLPLALEQAGAFMASLKASFMEYLDEYEQAKLDLFADEDAHPITGNYPHSILTTWTINFNAVQQENADAALVLQLSSVLAPDAIPFEVLTQGASFLGEPLSTALEGADQRPLKLRRLLKPLVKYSLIRWDEDGAESYGYSIHRMVQQVVKDQMGKEDAREWARRGAEALNLSFPEVEFGNWEKCNQLLPHVMILAPLLQQNNYQSKGTGRLYHQTGYFLKVQGRYEEAEDYTLKALAMKRELLGDRHPHVATSLNNLALIYESQGRYEKAKDYALQALEMRRSLLGDHNLHVAISLNTLAGLYESQGCYEEAEDYALQALEIKRELLGDRHPSVATSWSTLAGLYRSQGRYEEAEDYSLKDLEMSRELLGKSHPYVASSLNTLALLYEYQGRYEEAEDYALQALEIKRELLGERHPSVATSLHNLALIYKSQGRYEEAEARFLKSLEMKRELLDKSHPDTASSLNTLASLYQSLGRHEEAEDYALQALEMRRKLLGESHPDVANSLNNLALLYQSQGRYEEAEAHFLKSLEILRERLDDRHPSLATSLNNLAGVYNSQGRYEEAEFFYQQSLEMKRALLGDRHPSVAANLNNLALLYADQGRYEDAEDYALQALEMNKELLGESHPDVANSLNTLALLYLSQERYGEAEPYFLKALEMRREFLSTSHPSVATRLNNLAAFYESQGRYEEAEDYALQALAMSKNLLGESHPSVANSLFKLGLVKYQQGQLETAESLLLEARTIYEATVGLATPGTKALQPWIDTVQAAMNS